MAATLVWGSKR